MHPFLKKKKNRPVAVNCDLDLRTWPRQGQDESANQTSRWKII